MFVLAISLGILSYSIFLLGILGMLYPLPLHILGMVYLTWIVFYYYKKVINISRSSVLSFKQNSGLEVLSMLLLMIILLINVMGALSPELAFDSLWYHLALPKYFLMQHRISYIPGGLLYYSVMPKLVETLYILPLTLGDEILVKLVHYSFGLLSILGLYKLSRLFLPKRTALLVVVLLSSNLVFMWESTTAYIDIARTFFEIMGLWGYCLWLKSKQSKWFVVSAVMIGLAITTKVLALGSLGIILVLLVYESWRTKRTWLHSVKRIFIYGLTAVIIPLPWFILAYYSTGNPLYPFFSIYEAEVHSSLFSPWTFIIDMGKLFLFADDPITPIYLICLPLLFILAKRFSHEIKMVLAYSALSLAVWYLTPRTGGGRFILPYLPAFSLVIGELIELTKKYKFYQTLIIGLIIISASVSIMYRAAATSKFVPYLVGRESKGQFLTEHLNFRYGDFYDTDNYFAKNITPNDIVLLYGFHNLYYIDFPFLHESWVKKGDKFNYIATQQASLPVRFYSWKKIYVNEKTNVTLYTDNKQFIEY